MIYFQPLLGVCTLHCSLSSHLKCGWWELSDSWYSVKNIIRADKSGHENACFSPLRHQEDVGFYTDISCVNQKLGEINLALMDFPTMAHLKLKRHTLNWKGTICIRSRKKLVTVSPGAICPYCAWQCSKGHHKGERTAWNADPAPEEGVCGVWGCRAVTWLLPSLQVAWCLHPLQKSSGIRGQGPANPADARSAKAPGSRAAGGEHPYNGGFWAEGWDNLIWKLL